MDRRRPKTGETPRRVAGNSLQRKEKEEVSERSAIMQDDSTYLPLPASLPAGAPANMKTTPFFHCKARRLKPDPVAERAARSPAAEEGTLTRGQMTRGGPSMTNNEGTRFRASTGYRVEEDRASWKKKSIKKSVRVKSNPFLSFWVVFIHPLTSYLEP